MHRRRPRKILCRYGDACPRKINGLCLNMSPSCQCNRCHYLHPEVRHSVARPITPPVAPHIAPPAPDVLEEGPNYNLYKCKHHRSEPEESSDDEESDEECYCECDHCEDVRECERDRDRERERERKQIRKINSIIAYYTRLGKVSRPFTVIQVIYFSVTDDLHVCGQAEAGTFIVKRDTSETKKFVEIKYYQVCSSYYEDDSTISFRSAEDPDDFSDNNYYSDSD